MNLKKLFKRKNKNEFYFKGEKFEIVDREIFRLGNTTFCALGQIRHEKIIYVVIVDTATGKVYIEEWKAVNISPEKIKNTLTFMNDMVEDDILWQKLAYVAEKSGINTPCRRVLARELVFGEDDFYVQLEKNLYCGTLRRLFDG